MPPKRSPSDSPPSSSSSSSSKRPKEVEPRSFVVGGGAHTRGGLLLSDPSLAGKPAFAYPEWILPERARVVTTADFLGESSTATLTSCVVDPKLTEANCVLYWMSRDQRCEDNWALTMARQSASQLGLPLVVCFNLVPSFLGATLRQFGFMLEGLEETEQSLRDKSVPFYLLRGPDPGQAVADFATGGGGGSGPSGLVAGKAKAKKGAAAAAAAAAGGGEGGGLRAAVVFTDMSPLRVPMAWVKDGAKALAVAGIPLVQVDAHNIVPVWVASDKQEVGARTLRKKVHNHLPRFLPNQTPPLEPNHPPPSTSTSSSSSSSAPPLGLAMPRAVDWADALLSLQKGGLDSSVGKVKWAKGGAAAANVILEEFCAERLSVFESDRNDPTNPKVASNLSPWLHFGQLGPQRAVAKVKQASTLPGPGSGGKAKGKDSFVEEAVVRRELSDNFCFYNPAYDSVGGAAQWAQDSLTLHSSDPREHVYSALELEQGDTHDDLWNAAQLQLTVEGKMHGFLRMYWAKKVLEWTSGPEEALRIALWLNDKYSLDGRDPNGYVGCMWSVCGVHDTGWKERPVFGKVRFMNYAGCQRKFDVHSFVTRYDGASENALKRGGTLAKPKKTKAAKKK